MDALTNALHLHSAAHVQVHLADPAVWGSCVATDLFRQYSSICNHYNEGSCKADTVGCVYLPEYDAEVRQALTRPAAAALSQAQKCTLALSTPA